MTDQRFHTVLGRLDSGPRPGDDEIGERLWERIEWALAEAEQPERIDRPIPTTVDVDEDRDRWLWWWPRLLAAGVAAAVIVVVAVVAMGGGETTEIVPADPKTATSVPDPAVETTAVPVTTVPSTAPPDASVAATIAPTTTTAIIELRGPLEVQPDADTVLDVAFGPDDAPWVIVVPSGDVGWALLRWDGDAWRTMASEGDGSSPDALAVGPRDFPRFLGIRSDGSVWFLDPVEEFGPPELWEFDGNEWIDHNEVGLGGGWVLDMAPDGTIWADSPTGLRRYDDSGWQTVPDLTFEDLVERVGEPGFPTDIEGVATAIPDVVDQLDVDVDDADAACLEQLGVSDVADSVGQAVLDVAMGPDDAVWHSVVCVGVVRFDPADGTTTVFTLDETFPNRLVTSLTPAPDGTLWVTGTGGIARLDPSIGQ